MNPETPKPLVSRFASFLVLVFVSSTLNPFHQASSSAFAPHDDDRESTLHGGSDIVMPPESTLLQGGFDMGLPPQRRESESVEATNDELAAVTNSIPSASSSSSASAIPYGEEDTLSSSPLSRNSQINSINPTRVSFSSKDPSPSFPTKHSRDPNCPNTDSQNLHSAEADSWEHERENIDEQPAETSRRRDRLGHQIHIVDASITPYPWPSSSAISSRGEETVSFFSSSPPRTTENSQPAAETISRDPNSFHGMEIIDKQDLGKHILGLAIPTGVGLILSTSKLVVVIALSFAIDAIGIGLLLRKTYRKTSTVILMLGIALIMLAFYAFVGCFLPTHLKWIPAFCWFASLIPFAMYGWAYF